VLQAAVSFFRHMDNEEVALKRQFAKKLCLGCAEGLHVAQEHVHVGRLFAPPDDFMWNAQHGEVEGLGVGAHFHGGIHQLVKVLCDIMST